MESQNLRTASLYINNLLLSRGLLRNGKPIEFTDPAAGEGGAGATMARIINLVHDLVLRRDRETEQRENLATTIHTLRSSETKQNAEIERLQARSEHSERQLSIAQGQERAFKATLRTAESSVRGLREEMLRLKTMLQQVRSQCANDIRKRDIQIQRLKSQLSTQQRGTKPPSTASTITITPTGGRPGQAQREDAGLAVPVDSPDYSLGQETTEFLTQLSQNLSDENDNLIGLVRSTLTTLRALQGLSAASAQRAQVADAEGEQTNEEPSYGSSQPGGNLLQVLPTSYDTLATDMDDVLEHLRTLLTNPSFVPLEEVEVREEEIVRLRDGWETMEGKWREAVHMMDGWRKRMASGGKAVNLDELRLGLLLSPIRVGKVTEALQQDHDQVMAGADGESTGDEDGTEGTDVGHESLEEDDGDVPLGVGLRPDGGILSELHNDVQPDPTKRPVFASIPEESMRALADENGLDKVSLVNAPASKPQHDHDASSDRSRPKSLESKIPRQVGNPYRPNSPQTDLDKAPKRDNASEASPAKKRARLSKPTATVQQRLDRARVEAEEAQKRRAHKAGVTKTSKAPVRQSRKGGATTATASTKRKARRRSTLTMQELENLIGGGGGS
ncbi:MAG: hypothetical protein M1832_001009 [Thelocarpon impressellum]|nr:MAG: hypothetical protein M1832_001009 [Thelocarpon impressellum]